MKNAKKNKQIFLHEGHSYVTRRQLLGAGVIPFMGGMLMPSLWDVLVRNGIAQAAGVCPPVSTGGDGMPAIITINMSGGPAFGQFAVPLGVNQSPLTNAGNLGLGTNIATYNQVPMFANKLLVPQSNGQSMVTNLGAFFNAVSTGLTGTAATNVSVIGNAVDSGDDTGTNPGNLAGMVSKWITGRKLPPSLNGSNIGETPALVSPPAGLNVSSVTSVANAIAPATGALNATLSNQQKQDVYHLISNLSGSQAANLGAMPGGQTFSDLLNCAGVQNLQLAQSSAVSFDPRQDPIMQGIYGITANSNASSAMVVEATLVYCALKGLTPLAQMDFGGFDYHGSDAQTVTLPKDATAGAVANRALQAAAALGVKLFIYVQGDGATGADSTTAAGSSPSGDRGSGSATFLIAHDPKAPIAATRNFINGYTSGNVANPFYSSAPDGAAVTAFYNIVHNHTGSTAAADAVLAGISGAPSASVVSSILVI